MHCYVVNILLTRYVPAVVKGTDYMQPRSLDVDFSSIVVAFSAFQYCIYDLYWLVLRSYSCCYYCSRGIESELDHVEESMNVDDFQAGSMDFQLLTPRVVPVLSGSYGLH